MPLRQSVIAVLLAAGLALPARAAVNVYYHVGAWDAFDGQGDNGQPLCGIGTRNPADGRTFSLRFTIGGDDVAFIAAKPGWTIPDGTALTVVVQVGLSQPFTGQAVGKGDQVQWTVDRNAAQAFDAEFRRAGSMTVTFPSGDEPPWVISLSGSTAASKAMGRCVTDLTQRAAAAQPATTSAAPAAGSATQPFGAGAAAPANPAAAAQAPAPSQDQQTQDQQTQGQQTQGQPTQDQQTQPGGTQNTSH